MKSTPQSTQENVRSTYVTMLLPGARSALLLGPPHHRGIPRFRDRGGESNRGRATGCRLSEPRWGAPVVSAENPTPRFPRGPFQGHCNDVAGRRGRDDGFPSVTSNLSQWPARL